MTTLLLIDVQNDFHPGGSLAIPSANDDAVRIATFIAQHGKNITRIVATLDTHPKLHIAHPLFWINTSSGTHPTPFTIITTADIQNGKYLPRPDLSLDDLSSCIDPNIWPKDKVEAVMNSSTGKLDIIKYCIEYTKLLEQRGRFQLCIWPEHCLIGSLGHAVVPVVQAALIEWTTVTGKNVEFIQKGYNTLTEMYSVMAADVPITNETSMNNTLQQSLIHSSTNCLLIAGQALSHCVNYTVRDIVDYWQKQQQQHNHQQQNIQENGNSNDNNVRKICILTDCTSPVPGFENAATTFCNDMKQAGVQLLSCTDIILYSPK